MEAGKLNDASIRDDGLLRGKRPDDSRRNLRCFLCRGDYFRLIFKKKTRSFFRCSKCKLVRIHPLSALDGTQLFYDLEYGTAAGMGAALAAEREMACITARYRLDVVHSYTSGERWLDVGCSTGTLLDEVAKAGFHAEGIDISEIAVEEARRRRLNAHRATVEDFAPEAPYATITGFDVIEHVLDPVSFLTSVHKMLSPGGILALSTPNTNSLFCRLMGRHWYFYIPEQHLFYFNSRNLSTLLERSGFTVMDTVRAYKALTYDYISFQFKYYNPVLYRFCKAVAFMLPSFWRRRPFRLYIGEMMIIAKKV
jgi:2-polyprenyl-3-methyl-5-hydroxy-6-metoxy-1,4-benzoquinol methylase